MSRAEDEAFLDSESPLGGRPRRDSICDATTFLMEFAERLDTAVEGNDLARCRQAFREIKGWVDAIDDDICERNEDGSRKDPP